MSDTTKVHVPIEDATHAHYRVISGSMSEKNYPYEVSGPICRLPDGNLRIAGIGVSGGLVESELLEAWREAPAEPTELGTIVEVGGRELMLRHGNLGLHWLYLYAADYRRAIPHGKLPEGWTVVQERDRRPVF